MTSSSWRRLIAAIRPVHILLALATGSASATLLETGPLLIVPFIDVGQGDAVWVRMPDNVDMLVDDRPPSQGDELLLFLGEQGVIHIEVIVLILADADHVGGLNAVLKNTSVARVWPGDPTPDRSMEAYADCLEM